MAESPEQQLTKEVDDRLAQARVQKGYFDLDIREAYFFSAPEKMRSISSNSAPSKVREADQSVLQISIGIEEAENFATTLIRSFMPEGVPWMDLMPSPFIIDEGQRRDLTQKGKHDAKTVFELIAASNFYAELARALNPDGAVGTFGLWIDRANLNEPVRCQAVPLRELEINVGPDGSVDDRFAVRFTTYGKLRAVLGPEIQLTKAIEGKIEKSPKASVQIVWGFWRKWDKPYVCWQRVLKIDKELIESSELEGHGACPLIFATFNRHVEFAYGSGPLIKALPELRILDEMAGASIENVDLALRPPLTYPDDSFVNIEQGVVPGGFYPIRPGAEGAVKQMYQAAKLDAAYFEQKNREDRVRRLFYNDYPQQRGDTPPTATQWIDEMSMAQRKIGTPGLAFWREGPAEIFTRFYFMCLSGGLCQRVSKDGKEMALQPDNPTRQAQNQQKVAMVARVAQLGLGMFPEEFKVKIDGGATLQACIEALGLEDMMPQRPPQQIQQATQMLSQLAGNDPSRPPTIQPGGIGGPAPNGAQMPQGAPPMAPPMAPPGARQ